MPSKAKPDNVVPTRRVGRPANSDGAHTRQQVLNAAVVRLATVGYDRMTLDDVAKAAGITRAAIYRYFDSKQELARAAILQSSPHVDLVEGYYQEELAASPDGVASELRAFALACIRSSLDDPEPSLGYYDVGLLAGVDEESATIFRQRSRYVRGVLTTIVSKAAQRGEIVAGSDQRKIVDAMSGLIWAMAQGAASAPNARIRSQITLATDLLLQVPAWLTPVPAAPHPKAAASRPAPPVKKPEGDRPARG